MYKVETVHSVLITPPYTDVAGSILVGDIEWRPIGSSVSYSHVARWSAPITSLIFLEGLSIPILGCRAIELISGVATHKLIPLAAFRFTICRTPNSLPYHVTTCPTFSDIMKDTQEIPSKVWIPT